MRYLVGIGSWTMGDDSIGPRLVEAVADRGLSEGFEPVDLGNDLFKLLSFFTDSTRRLVIVDCVRMGQPPGTLARFSPDDVRTRKRTTTLSTHDGDLLKVIDLARETGQTVPSIRIIGIEPESVEPGLELSRALRARFEEYIRAALEEISA